MSPVISAIILIAVTVAVAIAAATWLGSMTFSFMTVEELQVTNCQWAPDVSYADLTVNNFGTDSVTIDEVKVNGELVNDVSIVTGSADLNAGENVVFRITESFIQSNSYTLSIIITKGTRIEYVSKAPYSSGITSFASMHYVNTTSNIDGSSDKGTHSNFADQQVGPDDVFDTLTEGDLGGLTRIIQYFESSISNVDDSDDVGTETNFVNSQDSAPDSDYMTIQEQNKCGSTTSEILFIGSDTQSGNNPTSGTFSFAGVSPQAGDFVLCWWYTRSNTKTITESAAVTQLYDVSSSSYGRLFLGYRIYKNGDSSYSWTSSSVSESTTSYGTSIFRNVNQTNPIDAQSGTPVGWSNAEDPNGPAVNVQTVGACVVSVFGKNNDFGNCNPPANYLLGGSTDSNSGSDASAGVAYRLISGSGSEDPPVWNLNGGSASDDGYVWTVALKPTITVTTD